MSDVFCKKGSDSEPSRSTSIYYQNTIKALEKQREQLIISLPEKCVSPWFIDIKTYDRSRSFSVAFSFIFCFLVDRACVEPFKSYLRGIHSLVQNIFPITTKRTCTKLEKKTIAYDMHLQTK